MNIKDFFKYTPTEKYNFTISANATDSRLPLEEQTIENIFSDINQNLNHIKSVYNTLINSDIMIREFTINCRNIQYKAFIVYIDGMVNTNNINHFILNPLMLKNTNNTFNGTIVKKITLKDSSENFSIKKIKNIDLIDYIYNSLIPENSIDRSNKFEKIISGINSGDCALFVDTINTAFNIDVKGFKQRGINPPNNEVVIKGPQESFVENIRTNTSLLRRITNNENLVIENLKVGKLSKTTCAVCYMKNIANNNLVAEVKYRMNNLDVDTIISTGQLEQLIEDNEKIDIPQMLSSERPDRCAKALMQGRVVILVNGNPYALVAPAIFKDFLTSAEDTNLKVLFSNFLKFLRFIALFLTLLLPGIYVSITGFHQEILPTELLFSILAARQNVPFPIIVELLIMEVSFELIREGGLRVPSPIGSTMGIIGALILGDAAVNANIVSPILIIIVAITGLSSFTIPDFYFEFHARIYRFIFILLGYIAGFLGIGLGIVIYVVLICNVRSFGIPFISSFEANNDSNKYFLNPVWKQEYRNKTFAPKIERQQENISKRWKFKK